jgi:GNAT superfamily N-acetyltransferase
MQIIELSEKPELFEKALDYYWQCWGNEQNRNFYEDAMRHSLDASKSLPKFYLLLDDEKIVGTYALITNDLNSRQDLWPWLACLFVEPEYRNQGLAEKMLNHGLAEAKQKGFDKLYLSSDLENFYEKKGWSYLADCYGFSGGSIKVYEKTTCRKPAI